MISIIYLSFGDWGLGIGDCPIPNPQSPLINSNLFNIILTIQLVIIIFYQL